MSFENWWIGDLLPRRCLGALPQYYYGSMTPEELLYKITYELNQLITNNNNLPDDVRQSILDYINSDEFKNLLFGWTDAKYIKRTGDTVHGDFTLNGGEFGFTQWDSIEGREKITISDGKYITLENRWGQSSAGDYTIEKISIDGRNLKIDSTGSAALRNIDISGQKIRDVGTPVIDGDAANKKYVDDKVAALGNVLEFKGVKATEADLPTTGNNVGDVWYVEATKSAWAWVTDTTDPAGRWDEFGPVINLEPYFKKADIVQSTGTGTDKVMSQKAATDSFVDVTGDTITGKLNIKVSDINKYCLELKNTSNPLRYILYYSDRFLVGYNNWWYNFKFGGSGFLVDLEKSSHPIPSGLINVINLNNVRVIGLLDPVNAQDAATKAYVDAHSGTYDLPIASENSLGGVKAPAKTASDNRQITVDSEGNLWTEDVVPYELPVANYNRLGGIKASVDVCPVPEKRQGVCVEPDGRAWVPKLVPAAANVLGGIKADESDEAMPVEIAIDPTTHKLKGALMTAYQSPTTIGGVVSNGEKTDADTVPVHMDSDGKQWVTPIGIVSNKNILANNDIAIIPGRGKLRIIATIMGTEGVDDIWIQSTEYSAVNKDFAIKLNRAVPDGKTLTVCYLLF